MARKSRKLTDGVAAGPARAATAAMYRTGAYVRLSVKDNHKKGDSIENQTAILQRYIDLAPDMELHDFYIDNGTSGMVFQRPQFERMLADAENGAINCIIVKDLSRLGRNAIDTGFYIEKQFPAMGVRFVAVNDDFDSINITDGAAGVMLHLKNLINEAYALEFSRKIRQQQNKAMLAGEFVGAWAPFGYMKAGDDCHKLVADPVAGPIVRQIFEWAAQGAGFNTIARRLNEAGVVTPSHHKHRQGQRCNEKMLGKGLWQTFTVRKILLDEVYTGNMVQGKSVSISKCQRPNAEENWIRVENTHEAIIGKELFAAVGKRLAEVAEKCAGRTVNPYTPNIFKGKVFCGVCGEPLHRQRVARKKTADKYIFHCLTNSRKARGLCVPYSMPERDLSAVLMDTVKAHAGALLGKAIQLRELGSPLDAERGKIAAELAAARGEAGKNDLLVKSLYENLVTGIITRDEYRQMRASFEARERVCLEHADALEGRLAELGRQAEEYALLAETAARAENMGITAELLDALVDRILIYPDRHIDVTFRFSNDYALLREVMGDA